MGQFQITYIHIQHGDYLESWNGKIIKLDPERQWKTQ